MDKPETHFALLITVRSLLLIFICSLLNNSFIHVTGSREIEFFGGRTWILVGTGFTVWVFSFLTAEGRDCFWGYSIWHRLTEWHWNRVCTALFVIPPSFHRCFITTPLSPWGWTIDPSQSAIPEDFLNFFVPLRSVMRDCTTCRPHYPHLRLNAS